MKIAFTLLHEQARLPERGHDIDVGLDVFTPEAGVLQPGPNKIPLGFSMSIPVGYSASIYPRSGMVSGEKTKGMVLKNYSLGMDYLVEFVHRNGVSLQATMPPIDPGYTGEVHAIVINHSSLYISYPMHTRFGQLVVHPIVYAIPVGTLDFSRGSKGFGSTGADKL